MNKKQLDLVEEVILSVYATNHACSLANAEPGLPKGTPCELCKELAKAQRIELEKRIGKKR
jgi:hypothetical protein